MSECKVYRREIAEGFDSTMSRGARAHAEVCRDCGDELRGRESLRALVGGLAKVEAPSDFEFRLRARMAASGATGRRGPLGGLRLVYAFAPVAAAACLLVVSTALYLRQASRPSPAESPSVAVVESARNAADGQTASKPDVKIDEAVRTGVGTVNVELGTATPPARPLVQRQRPAARQTREVAAKLEGRAAVPERNTADFSVTQAPVINGRGVTIALRTTAEPMRMILRDERGTGRVVPMRAVSFGSQELIARDGVSRQLTAAENEGVW